MLAGGNADGNSRVKMAGDEGLKTVECLRGRLLAERAASRVAKEEAEFMGNRLIELQKLLKEETKSRNKAEKRLKLLLGKLESLKIVYVSDESENGCCSDRNSETSTRSSTASSSVKLDLDPNVKEAEATSEVPASLEQHISECHCSSNCSEKSSREENDRSREDGTPEDSYTSAPASSEATSLINEHKMDGEGVSEVLVTVHTAACQSKGSELSGEKA